MMSMPSILRTSNFLILIALFNSVVGSLEARLVPNQGRTVSYGLTRTLHKRQNYVAQAPYEYDPNQKNWFYAVNVSIGTPPQNLYLLLSTGGGDISVPTPDYQRCAFYPRLANESCPASIYYANESSTAVNTDQAFLTKLISGPVNSSIDLVGEYYTDRLTFSGVTIPEQQFAVSNSSGLGTFNIGLEYFEGTVDRNPYPTFMQNLVTAGAINTAAVSLTLRRDGQQSSLIFGGLDKNSYSGSFLELAPPPDYITNYDLTIDSVDFSKASWAVPIAGFGVSGTQLSNAATVGFVFAGANALFVNFNTSILAEALNATVTSNGALVADCSRIGQKSNITFDTYFGGPGLGEPVVFSIDANEFIRYAYNLNNGTQRFNPDSSPICLFQIANNGDGGQGYTPTVYLGLPFLEAVTVVLDADRKRVYMANKAEGGPTGQDIVEISAAGVVPGVIVPEANENGTLPVPSPTGVSGGVSLSVSKGLLTMLFIVMFVYL